MPFEQTYYDSYTRRDRSWETTRASRQYNYDAMVRKALRYAGKPETIVEVGCGLGFMSATLARLPWKPEVHCGDVSEHAVSTVRSVVSSAHPNVHPKALDAQNLDFPDAFADLLLAFDVIEHLPQPEAFISEAFRVLKPGGVLFISTPNPGSLGNRTKGNAPRETGRHYLERIWEWHGNRDNTHISIKSIAEWRRLFAASGFKRLSDGSDYLWDTPYFRLPILPQKLVFNGSHRILTRLSIFAPWTLGENYYALWTK